MVLTPIIVLPPSKFETVTLDDQGKEIARRELQSEYYIEDLGDGVRLSSRSCGEDEVALLPFFPSFPFTLAREARI